MPEEGIKYLPKKDLLSFEEIERIVRVLAEMGITKVRLTGGEPFLRTDLIQLIEKITHIQGINDVHVTSNGVLLGDHVKELKALGVASVNLSLDTLNAERFKKIARRDEFAKTWNALQLLIENEIPVKINSVVMDGKNIDDIIPIVELTRNENISVRFIEEMPFNGEGSHYSKLNWTYKRILDHIKTVFPDLQKINDPENATAYHYQVPDFKGNVGIIAAFSRTFCGSCNRIRITAQGVLKTCLYDDGVLNIKDLLRDGESDEVIKKRLLFAFNHRAKDGIEAETQRKQHPQLTESMSTIGG
jgi:cyclic pyranopterin phosphate synthase